MAGRRRRSSASPGIGHAVLIRGPLGVGKSTVAQALCRRIGAEWISIDPILTENGLEEEWEDGYISQRSFRRANELAVAQAAPLLARCRSVVFDGNFYWRSQVADLRRRLSRPLVAFTLEAPLEVCLDRDRHRPIPQGEAGAREVFAKVKEFNVGVRIDATRPFEGVVKEIQDRLTLRRERTD